MATNYWSPGAWNSPQGYDWGNTQYGEITKEQNPDTAYYRYGRELGVQDDNSAFSRWFSQQFPQVQQGYNAATISNPYLLIDPYMQSLGGYQDWYQKYMALAPQLRGEDQSSRGAAPVRWIAR
jgi:hypothetical protein